MAIVIIIIKALIVNSRALRVLDFIKRALKVLNSIKRSILIIDYIINGF
jgi:hypothetical protein